MNPRFPTFPNEGRVSASVAFVVDEEEAPYPEDFIVLRWDGCRFVYFLKLVLLDVLLDSGSDDAAIFGRLVDACRVSLLPAAAGLLLFPLR